uniref:dolichol kinase n=1 Tax=Ditylenchus dipsaci TaxID=166011 RepID=A0A915DZF9_9BILA
MVLILGPSAFNAPLIVTSVVSTVVEAHLKVCDNVTLPLISASIIICWNESDILNISVMYRINSAVSELWDVKQRHFAGVQSVGIGDSCAAIFGTYFGRTKWTTSYGRKSLEGSLAMLVSQVVFMVLILGPSAFNAPLIVTSVVSTVVEAHLKVCDNVTLPLISASIYYLLE